MSTNQSTMAETEMKNVLGPIAPPPFGVDNSANLRQRAVYSKVNEDNKDDTSGDRTTPHNLSRENSPGNKFSKKTSKRSKSSSHSHTQQYSASKITYRSQNIHQAASQGNLPLCVLLWGMSSAKRVCIFVSDNEGNNPMHHAVLADSPEVVSFLLQQTKGQLEDGTNVLNAKNNYGETPLLRSVHMGQIPVIKLLIDEGSNPFDTDSGGNTIMMTLAKQNHLWCLNFVFEAICTNHGIMAAMNLLAAVDNEFHTALDWAAYSGNINVVEYLIRKGMNPYRVDRNNRSPLYWACKGNCYYTVKLLVQAGCDPNAVDVNNDSPMSLAVASQNTTLVNMLKVSSCLKRDHPALSNVVSALVEDSNFIPPLTSKKISSINRKSSNAINLHRTTRARYALFYALLISILWLLSCPMPSYAWLLMMLISTFFYRRNMKIAKKKLANVADDRARLTVVEDLLTCPERGIGMWIAGAAVYTMYAALSLLYNNGHGQYGYTWALESGFNPLRINGISGDRYFFGLFWAFVYLLVSAVISWCYLTLVARDPGVVDTRERDFDEILSLSYLGNELNTNGQYCKTTLVKKPFRSKFCSKLGVVVARMDHHCFWLNTTIGAGNHRAFMSMLIAHEVFLGVTATLLFKVLIIELGYNGGCSVMSTLLNRQYFIILVTLSVTLLALSAITVLLFDQSINIIRNLTTNERINGERYAWLKDDEGGWCNRYNRGRLRNILEFFGVPGFKVDYLNTFELPPIPACYPHCGGDSCPMPTVEPGFADVVGVGGGGGAAVAGGKRAGGGSITSAGGRSVNSNLENPAFGESISPSDIQLTASNLMRKQNALLQRGNLELGQRASSDYGTPSELTFASDNSRAGGQQGQGANSNNNNNNNNANPYGLLVKGDSLNGSMDLEAGGGMNGMHKTPSSSNNSSAGDDNHHHHLG